MQCNSNLLIIVILSLSVLPWDRISYAQDAGEIEVFIAGLKNSNGEVFIDVYDDSDAFPTKPKLAVYKKRSNIKDGKASTQFSGVKYGTYAIGVYHDENGNTELDTNFIGIPKEGTGVSNNVRAAFGPPSFKDASFTLNKTKEIIKIQVQY